MGRWPASWPEEAYFIGIGGIAMVSLARVLARRGVRVRGCDNALYPPASLLLADAAIDCAVPPTPEHLGRGDPLVVVGNAISRGHPVLERALERGLALASLPEVIERLLIPGRRVTAVAGTHGKTTTAALLSWIHAS
ncbi:MAG: Mur ligase domain-containing protein, partial [Acidobacteriota bacterium]|nr:Mur ligase domain-containing protein [Acidobacteriota bacterium]